MTIVAPGPQHFQAMCGTNTMVNARLREPTSSPAQGSLKEALVRGTNTKVPTNDGSGEDLESTRTSIAFVYGTLKRGFGNHWLMAEQMSMNHCRLLGIAKTKCKFPLVCGPFQVPFLLNMPGCGEHVLGEIYQVDSHCLRLLDELEGTSKGHYVRCPVTLTAVELDPSLKSSLESGLDGISPQQVHSLIDSINQAGGVHAEAYFAALHYTPGLFQAPHIEAYTEKESATYTRRVHRPQHRTFIEHVYHWIDEQQKISALQN